MAIKGCTLTIAEQVKKLHNNIHDVNYHCMLDRDYTGSIVRIVKKAIGNMKKIAFHIGHYCKDSQCDEWYVERILGDLESAIHWYTDYSPQLAKRIKNHKKDFELPVMFDLLEFRKNINITKHLTRLQKYERWNYSEKYWAKYEKEQREKEKKDIQENDFPFGVDYKYG